MLYIPEQHERDDDGEAPLSGEEIPQLYFHPRDLVHRTPQKRADRYADAFVYEPENVDERQLGTLAIVGEVSEVEARPTLHIVNLIASTCKKEYYRLPRRGAKRSFEAALQKVNAALTDFTIQGFTDWLGHLDVLIVAFDGHHIHATRIGDARALLVRDSNILDITESLSSPTKRRSADAEALKSFSNIVHGALLPDDTVVLATKTLFQHLSIEQIRTQASERTPKSFLFEVRRMFAASDDDTSPMFAAIAAVITESATPIDEPEDEPMRAAMTVEEIVERPVEHGDADDMDEEPAVPTDRESPPPRVPLTRPRNWKQSIVYWLRRIGRLLADGAWYVGLYSRKYIGPALKKAGRWTAKNVVAAGSSLAAWVRDLRKGRVEARAEQHGDEHDDSVMGDSEMSHGDYEMPDHDSDDMYSDGERGMPQESTSRMRGAANVVRRQLTRGARSASTASQSLRSSPIAAKIAIGVVILLVVSLVASLLLRRQSAEQELADQQLLEQRALIDEQLQQLEVHIIYKQYDKARELLVGLRDQVDAYADLGENAEGVPEYRESLTDAADKIDQIVRINDVTGVVADLSAALPSGLPQGLLGSTTTLYAYDAQGNVVSVPQTGGEAQTVGSLGRSPLHAGLIEQRDAIVFYTESGIATMDVDTGEVTDYELEGLLQGDIRDLATYATSFYYFDLENNQILRQSVTPQSVTDGIAWIKLADRVDLTDARALAIDGSVYVLFKDGRITRFLSGFQKETVQPTLSDPIEDATQIFAPEDSEQLYVVEPSKQRLIVLSATGEVEVQYTGDAFVDIRDIWVQPETQTVFVLAGTRVFELTE